jgi:tRNA A-37 threonylcarbamoyl transferase component Bud32
MANDSFRLPSRYHSLELIAHGGMADVYRATDAELGRDVAIKVLSERHADDQELRARFTREAQTAAGLSAEPGIVTIFDVGESDGRPYIVMELLTGGTVADRIRAGRVPYAQALAWLEQAARALDAAHAHGVIHRDVKPANLMLSRDGNLSVADFGIARAAGLSSLTSTGTIMGTSGYMSPEQARGGRATEASDRYALAVVAFELLTGRRPFVAENLTAEAAAHASAPVPKASSVNRELPAGVDAVLSRGMAKEPAARYETCVELVWALRRAFQDSTATTVHDTATTKPVIHTSRRRVGIPALAAGLAALGLLAAGALAAAVLTDAGDGGPEAVTLVRTQTVEGAERLRTVTIEVPTTVQSTEQTEPRSQPAASSDANGAQLNDQGFRLMQARDFSEALPLLEQAVDSLRGSGELTEAWASYNLAFTRLALGDCSEVEELLDRSEQVQGERKEIDRLRREARKACGDKRGGEGDD